MSLTKADMAEMLFDELGLNKREAKEIVELFFEEVKVALETGHQVKLSGFGNFLTRSKAERPGRNPKNRRGNTDICAKSGYFPPRSKIENKSRGICWKRATITNYR